jgi:hypothetical protein
MALDEPTNDVCPRCLRPFEGGDLTVVATAGLGDLDVGPFRIHVECQRSSERDDVPR